MYSMIDINGRLCLGICGFAALFCLSPLIFVSFGRVYAEANDATIQSFNDRSTDSANSYTAFFFVTVISAADVLLDVPPKFASYLNIIEKTEKSQTAIKISRLSEFERLVFIVGVLLQSSVGFLPTSTETGYVDFVSNCTKNASILLIFAPIVVYLQRCTSTFTIARIFVIAVLGSIGYGLQTLSYFVEPRSYSRNLLIIFSEVFMYAVSFLFTIFSLSCAFKFCMEKIQARKLPVNRPVNSGTTGDDGGELYTNYIPGLHMLSALFLIYAEVSVNLSPSDQMNESIRNRNYIVLFAVVMVLVIELRVRKNEIARELVRHQCYYDSYILLSCYLLFSLQINFCFSDSLILLHRLVSTDYLFLFLSFCSFCSQPYLLFCLIFYFELSCSYL